MKYPRVLFILKKLGIYGNNGQPVTSSGLGNSARFVMEMLKSKGFDSDLVYVNDNNDIHRETVKFNADIVIIEAFWVVPSKFDELKKVLPKVKFVVRNHSETPFLANEGMAFGWIAGYLERDNVWLGTNSTRMFSDTVLMARIGNQSESKVLLMPNYYPLEGHEPHVINTKSEFVNIGCFGAIRPLKNHMTQALAALKFATEKGKRLRFHINTGRVEMNGNPILKNLIQLFAAYPQHELINHGWLAYDEFKKLAGTMDMAMQVSLSETFNIVAADTVSLGVPTIVSPEVRWAAPCYQANPTSVDDIADVLTKAWNIGRMLPKLNSNIRGLRKYNSDSQRVWTRELLDLNRLTIGGNNAKSC